ncbi:hypothetical protein ACPXB5_25355 [Micromonospora arida]|uniref:hypothetical protein n=1 Tax=Micromonospora arida TaxID=2203715 RepID=UPI001ABF88EE|nr:hypothetical protein [Micromonospora arida]
MILREGPGWWFCREHRRCVYVPSSCSPPWPPWLSWWSPTRIAYHRFAVPIGNGTNRETAIDRMEFSTDGTIRPVVPTL